MVSQSTIKKNLPESYKGCSSPQIWLLPEKYTTNNALYIQLFAIKLPNEKNHKCCLCFFSMKKFLVKDYNVVGYTNMNGFLV